MLRQSILMLECCCVMDKHVLYHSWLYCGLSRQITEYLFVAVAEAHNFAVAVPYLGDRTYITESSIDCVVEPQICQLLQLKCRYVA